MALLLQHSADVDIRDKEGSISLHRASGEGNLDLIRLLLEHRTDVNAQDALGKTPLHVAVGAGELDIVRLLLQHGGHGLSERLAPDSIERRIVQCWPPCISVR